MGKIPAQVVVRPQDHRVAKLLIWVGEVLAVPTDGDVVAIKDPLQGQGPLSLRVIMTRHDLDGQGVEIMVGEPWSWKPWEEHLALERKRLGKPEPEEDEG